MLTANIVTSTLLVLVASVCWSVVLAVPSAKHARDADAIINFFTKDAGKTTTHRWLANLTDSIGNRYANSPRYQQAVQHMLDQLRLIGVDRVWTEEASNIPNWHRSDPRMPNSDPGRAVLLQPRRKEIAILALGNSTATPPNGGIKAAKAVVVRSFDELQRFPDEKIDGAIVVYNQPWMGYDKSVDYRNNGAIRAAARGAVAVLVRSVTPQSLYTLHAGAQASTNDSRLQIPAASITVEDAELLQRLQDAGHELVLSLQVNTVYFGTTSQNNVIAEIRGTTHPDEMVVFSGHLDSWDVGEGAMDDGGGVAITFQVLNAVKALGLAPKRTLRAVFWAAEEFGHYGSNGYYALHKNEAKNMSFAMESDSGTFKPVGLHFDGNAAAQAVMRSQVMPLLASIDAKVLSANDGTDDPDDLDMFVANDGVPGAELDSQEFTTQRQRYFWYHHTEADTMTMMNSTELDLCAAVWTVVAYTVADLDELLPKTKH